MLPVIGNQVHNEVMHSSMVGIGKTKFLLKSHRDQAWLKKASKLSNKVYLSEMSLAASYNKKGLLEQNIFCCTGL